MKPAPKPVSDGLARVVLAVQLVTGREMALEPELLKLTLCRRPKLLSQHTSWAKAAGAEGMLSHELVLLVMLRVPKLRPLSLQRVRAEHAGPLLLSDRVGLFLLQLAEGMSSEHGGLLPMLEGKSIDRLPGDTSILCGGPLRGHVTFLQEAAEHPKGPGCGLDGRDARAVSYPSSNLDSIFNI